MLNQGLVWCRGQHGAEAKVESGFLEGACGAERQLCGRLCVGLSMEGSRLAR